MKEFLIFPKASKVTIGKEQTQEEEVQDPGSHKKIQTESTAPVVNTEKTVHSVAVKTVLKMEGESISLPLKSTIDSDRKQLSTSNLRIQKT